MGNSVRGEIDVAFGETVLTVALTFRAMVAIEQAFGIENFEEVMRDGVLTRVEGEGEGRRLFVHSPQLLKFWKAVLEGNGKSDFDLGAQAVNPYKLAAKAFELINTARDTWFSGDAEGGGADPLGAAGAGDTG